MASTPLLGLSLPADGTTNWGTLVNTSITALIDSAVAGTTTLSADTDVTLTTTTEATNQARQAVILCSGARTAIRTITAPAQSKTYVVINNTTGGFAVQIVGAGPTTGVTVPNGKAYMVAWNGSEFVVTGVTSINLATDVTGVLPVANGGTGGTTSTGSGAVVLATSPTLVTPSLGTPASGNFSSGTFTWPTFNQSTTGSAGSVANSVTFNNGGSGDASGTTYNGSAARTISYNTIGAPSATGSGASGTWSININGTVGAITPSAGTFSKLLVGTGSFFGYGNVTPPSNTAGQFNVTAQGTLAFVAPSGSPSDSQKLILRIVDDGTARAMTWNAIYRAVGVTLPSTTIANKTTYVGCIYNSTSSTWDVVAVTTQA